MLIQDISALKELERLREEWASIVAHDLRQPVNSIGLAAQIIARTSPGDPGFERAVKSIQIGVGNLDRMIDDLLDASLIEARRMTIAPRALDVRALVEGAVGRAPDLGGRSEVNVDPEAGVVWADPGRVEQVLANLLSNAIKYAEPGSPIRIDVSSRQHEVEVIVTNRGGGIPPDELSLLFSRFARTREARRGRQPGLGLGLHICKGLVEAQGGRIWAESTPGERTLFHFTLPRPPTRPPAGQSADVGR